jgi:hypothetical protein
LDLIAKETRPPALCDEKIRGMESAFAIDVPRSLKTNR